MAENAKYFAQMISALKNLGNMRISKKIFLFIIIEIAALTYIFYHMVDVFIRYELFSFLKDTTGSILIIGYHIYIIGIIITSIIICHKYKGYGRVRFIPNIIIIGGLICLFFPLGWLNAEAKFYHYKNVYLSIIQQCKNNELKPLSADNYNHLKLLKQESNLSMSGNVRVQREPFTVFFMSDDDNENVGGILYREGDINYGKMEDSTNLNAFLGNEFKIWKIQDNWYWVETYTVHYWGD